MTFWPDVPSYDTHCHNNYILQTDHTRPEKKNSRGFEVLYIFYIDKFAVIYNLFLSTLIFWHFLLVHYTHKCQIAENNMERSQCLSQGRCAA